MLLKIYVLLLNGGVLYGFTGKVLTAPSFYLNQFRIDEVKTVLDPDPLPCTCKFDSTAEEHEIEPGARDTKDQQGLLDNPKHSL